MRFRPTDIRGCVRPFHQMLQAIQLSLNSHLEFRDQHAYSIHNQLNHWFGCTKSYDHVRTSAQAGSPASGAAAQAKVWGQGRGPAGRQAGSLAGRQASAGSAGSCAGIASMRPGDDGRCTGWRSARGVAVKAPSGGGWPRERLRAASCWCVFGLRSPQT